MKNAKRHALEALCLVPLTAMSLWSAEVQAQTAPAKAPAASMAQGHMQKGAAGSHDMKESMMTGMDGMQKMQMSGDTDKDFAMMMKVHHQGAVSIDPFIRNCWDERVGL